MEIITKFSMFFCIFFITSIIINKVVVDKEKINNFKIKLEKKIKKDLANTKIFNFSINVIYLKLFSVIISIVIFFTCYKLFNIISCSLVLAIVSLRLPYIIKIETEKKRKNNILKSFPSYLVCLKNYINTKNDIIYAMKKVNVEEPLNSYINMFNNNIQNGVSIVDGFEMLKNSIGINKLNGFFVATQYSYINGGDFANILDKYSKFLLQDNIRDEKSKQELLFTKIIIFIMMFINVVVLFSFVFSNIEYKNIVTGTFIGKIIININIITYILIYFIERKLEE